MFGTCLLVSISAALTGQAPCINGLCELRPRRTILVRPQTFAQLPPAVVAPVAAPAPEPFFFGVDEGKLDDRDRWMANGQEISQTEAQRLVASSPGGTVPDDGRKPHLTLIANSPEKRRELQSMIDSPEASPIRENYRVQVYDLTQKVDRAMIGGYRADEDERWKKAGQVAIIQHAAAKGSAPIAAVHFEFKTATHLLEAVRKADKDFELAKVKPPVQPDTAPSLIGVTHPQALAMIFVTACVAFCITAFSAVRHSKGG